MNPDSPLFSLALLAVVCNIVGVFLSARLVWQNALDYHAARVVLIDRVRTRVARHSFISESVRCYIQAANLLILVIAVFYVPQRFNEEINRFWPLTLANVIVDLTVSIALMINGVEGMGMRGFVREAIIMDPDPNDIDHHAGPKLIPASQVHHPKRFRIFHLKRGR